MPQVVTETQWSACGEKKNEITIRNPDGHWENLPLLRSKTRWNPPPKGEAAMSSGNRITFEGFITQPKRSSAS